MADEARGDVERGEGKALSLEDIAEKVRRAFYRQFASEDDDWAGPYLMEVYEAYGIASLDGEKYRVAYEMTADGITFTPREAWELVEKDWVPASVGAAAPLKDASTVVAWGEAVKALGGLWGRIYRELLRRFLMEHFSKIRFLRKPVIMRKKIIQLCILWVWHQMVMFIVRMNICML
jgi:hypothetical protein